MANSVRVRVPATSANLGPGFDCLGLALGRYDTVTARRCDGPPQIEVHGVGKGLVAIDERNLVYATYRHLADRLGVEAPPLNLVCENVIPHGSGQGSSSAAIVSGLAIGRALLPGGSALFDDDLIAIGTEIEGHPDNIAPAILGGFVIARMDAGGRPHCVRRHVHPAISAVVFTADFVCPTSAARAILPDSVPRADALANVASAALLVHALTQEPGLLLPATEDCLHQEYRRALMEPSMQLVDSLRAKGHAAVISGAGATVLALVDKTAPRAFNLADWQHKQFSAAILPIDISGVRATLGAP